jgi:hypothetical protein
MTIEIISTPDCPNHQPTVERVKALVKSEGVKADVREFFINNESDAKALRFNGSPTVRVNGEDVEPLALARTGLSCRLYPDGTGVPPLTLLQAAVSSAKRGEI